MLGTAIIGGVLSAYAFGTITTLVVGGRAARFVQVLFNL